MSETPSDYNAKIIGEFRANEGRVGGMWEEIPLLVLHHTGAQSGVSRVNPVAYLPNDPGYLIWAANGGASSNPNWYHNLKAPAQHANRGRHRDDRCRGRGGGRGGARAPLHESNRTLPAARRNREQDPPRHSHDRPHTPRERLTPSPEVERNRCPNRRLCCDVLSSPIRAQALPRTNRPQLTNRDEHVHSTNRST